MKQFVCVARELDTKVVKVLTELESKISSVKIKRA